MLPIQIVAAAVGARQRLSVLGEVIVGVQVTPINSLSSLNFNSDGTVDKELTSGTTQIDAATDWIIPNSLANSGYQVRAQSIVWNSSGDGEAFTAEGIPTDNTWADLGTTRKLTILQSADTPATKKVTFTIELRIGTGPVVASATYSLEAEVSA